MLQTPSRASTASSSSYQALSRQNTMSSYDGSRSARQSKRYSMSALYMSMSAQETDLEIEDDLAKGLSPIPRLQAEVLIKVPLLTVRSPENTPGLEVQDLLPIQEELRA